MKMRKEIETRRALLAKVGLEMRKIYRIMEIPLTNQKLREHLAPQPQTAPPGWYADRMKKGAHASATLDHLQKKLLARHPELAGRIDRPGYEPENWQEAMHIRPAGESGSPIVVVHDHMSELTIGFEYWHSHIEVREEARMIDLIERMMQEQFVIRDLVDAEGGWHQSGPVEAPEAVTAHPEWITHLVSFAGKYDRVIPAASSAGSP